MTTTMKKALVPAYLTSFQCIRPACEDSCCSAWRIHIDKPTYKKYVNLRQSPFSFEVKKKLKRIRNGSDTRYAEIILESNKACPFPKQGRLVRYAAGFWGRIFIQDLPELSANT